MKLKKILDQRGLTYKDLFNKMKEMGMKPVSIDAISEIIKHNRPVVATLQPIHGKGYPSTLERICKALDIKSSDILDY